MILQSHIKFSHLNTCKNNIKLFNNQQVNRKYCVGKIRHRFNFYYRVKKSKKCLRNECERTVCNFIWCKKSISNCKKQKEEISFPCNQCYKAFSDKNELKDHLFDHYSFKGQ